MELRNSKAKGAILPAMKGKASKPNPSENAE